MTDIDFAARRIAAAESEQAAAGAARDDATSRLTSLRDRLAVIQQEASSIRANTPLVSDLASDVATRLWTLEQDADGLAELIEQAVRDVNFEANLAQQASMALDVARRDMRCAEASAQIVAVEDKARQAEAVLVSCIVEVANLKEAAGVSIRCGSDIFRLDPKLAKFAGTGFIERGR